MEKEKKETTFQMLKKKKRKPLSDVDNPWRQVPPAKREKITRGIEAAFN